MLRLEKVSKIYSANGLVATGFSKVDLELDMGEFVAITGESGSGKSTLLNVISGLDSYEEGEMYIMGEPTSGFSKSELEEYRKKYIGNIFQTFNLINSYTVYQNVELVLLMSGYDSKDIEEKVNEIIEKVGLAEYTKTKASKLSGGQKQRVAIARALAKETPIIVADEPTGNLDSQSAADIIELLHKLSEEKLIIIVTHNYDQVEKYVTRKISMHDGQIVEDKSFDKSKKVNQEAFATPKSAKADSLNNKTLFRLGLRNTFNIPAKLILLLAVFVFLSSAVIAQYSSFLNMSEATSGLGFNQYFQYTGKDRVLVVKQDKSQFTQEDYDTLGKIPNVKKVVENDILLDSVGDLSDEDGNYNVTIKVADAKEFKGKLEKGRMPENDDEAIMIFPHNQSYVADTVDSIIDKNSILSNNSTGMKMIKNDLVIVGYGYASEEETSSLETGNLYCEAILYPSEGALNQIRYTAIENYCTQEYEFAGKITQGNSSQGTYQLIPNENVKEGKVYIPEEIAALSTSQYVTGKDFTITNKSIYFTDNMGLKVAGVYTKENIARTLKIKDFDSVSGAIFVNQQDYNKLFYKGNYQSSVIVSDTKTVADTVKAVNDAGYKSFQVSEGLMDLTGGFGVILTTFRVIMLVAVLLVLFFISYFIIKLIMKSRNIYYSTIRMLGATKKNCKGLIRVELFAVFNIAFILCMIVVALSLTGVIQSEYLANLLSFLHVYDYFILYGILCVISMWIAGRYSKQMFKKTAMNAHKEEV